MSDDSRSDSDSILILDFGAQTTQLIARRVRESGVYCEVHPFNMTDAAIDEFAPSGIVLSGGPASVTNASTPRAPERVFEIGVPLLGICYGQQTMCAQLGGTVESDDHREFGRASIDISGQCDLFDGVWDSGAKEQVWMSHGDRVTALPPGFRPVARSEGAPYAAIADDERRYYGVQFHPEVVHTPHGAALIDNFVKRVAGCKGTWTMAAFREQEIARARAQIGDGHVICGLSGGVDSSVVAVLLQEAVGDQLTCVFVDTGLMREGEADEVKSLFHDRFNIKLIHRDAGDLFLGKLAGAYRSHTAQASSRLSVTTISPKSRQAASAEARDRPGRAAITSGINARTCSPRARRVVTSQTGESGPCSA